jgi:hypothetical protein
MRPRARAIAFLGLAGCASVHAVPPSLDAAPQAETADAFVGKWYVDPTRQDGLLSDSLVTRKPDGTMTIAFRLCNGDKLLTYDEAGSWSVTGDLYLARTHISRTIDGTPPNGAVYEHAYRIERASAHRLAYRSTEGGDIFEARRVSPAFEPSPNLCASGGERRTGG